MAVFQPAEETGEGAQAIIDDGLFDRFPKPDVVLGQHVMVGSAGTIGGRAGVSTYVRNGVTSWMNRWKGNGWLTQERKPVKNADLWQRLEAAMAPHEVEWHWVKGHAGDAGNERADRLATRGAREARGMGATEPPRKATTQPAMTTAQAAIPMTLPATTKAPATRPATTATTNRPKAAQATPATKTVVAQDEDECVHQMPAAWCALCKPPRPGVLAHGYRTAIGSAYHNDPDCDWLRHGQNRSAKQGRNVHEVVAIAWADVNPAEVQPCDHCCTPDWLRRHGH
jgi:hypothetical protein